MQYETAQTEDFIDWLSKQTAEVREMIATRIARFQSGLLGDVAPVGGKVSEMRIHDGPGYRVYYTVQGRVLVILLCGGTKRTQKKDITRAKDLAAKL